MQIKTLAVVLTTIVGLAAAAPAPEPEIDARGEIDVRAKKSWTAKGGCKTDWAGRCGAQCIGEGLGKGCKKADIDSGIESSHCVWGWNICRCRC